MADGVSRHQEVARSEAQPLPQSVGAESGRRLRRESSPHSHKFMLASAMLVGVAVAALVVAAAILIKGGTAGPQEAWSSWSPPDSGIQGEREIADEVAPFYRASPSQQLVVVTVQNLSGSSSNTGTQLAVRDPSSGTLSAVSGNSAVYSLCGLGSNCAISAGTPSAARLLLLRREALELALYTFKYVGGVDNVVAILPPGHASSSCTGICPKPPSASSSKTQTAAPLNIAVVFQKQSLQHFLDQPLRETLPEQLPPSVADMPSAPEAELVSVLTGQALFQQQLIQAQDGSSVLVLDPLPAQ